MSISTVAFDSELPLTRQRAIGSRQTARLEFVVRTPTIVRDLVTSSKLEESLPILPIEGYTPDFTETDSIKTPALWGIPTADVPVGAYEGARPGSRRSSDSPYREISRDGRLEIPACALFDVSVGKQIINGDA